MNGSGSLDHAPSDDSAAPCIGVRQLPHQSCAGRPVTSRGQLEV